MTKPTYKTDAELEIVRTITEALEPLSQGARARVLLHAILARAPTSIDNAQLWQLVVLGKQP